MALLKRQKARTFLVNCVHRTLRGKKDRTEKILGYSKEELINHLESRLQKGMGWHNYGNKKGCWQIDHIKPITLFLKEGVIDPATINALNNLRPLWKSANQKKYNHYDIKKVGGCIARQLELF